MCYLMVRFGSANTGHHPVEMRERRHLAALWQLGVGTAICGPPLRGL